MSAVFISSGGSVDIGLLPCWYFSTIQSRVLRAGEMREARNGVSLGEFCNAPVAQLVELLPFKEKVPGSNPGRGTNKVFA